MDELNWKREKTAVAYFTVAPIIHVETQGKNEDPSIRIASLRTRFETVTSKTRSKNGKTLRQ